MARRPTKNRSGIRGTGAVRYNEIWRVFGCARPGCQHVLRAREADVLEKSFVDACETCGQIHFKAEADKGARWKYCRVCEQLQPLENFHRHRGFPTGRQLECKTCKNRKINPHGNPLRTKDQHREAADRRRLYVSVSGEQKQKLNEAEVYERFSRRCFNCGKPLKAGEGAIDHTLPAMYLWPCSTGPTLLCKECNGNKAERWPSEFYRHDDAPDRAKLQRLSVFTGIPYDVLAGEPHFNPVAVETLKSGIDEFLVRWIRYPDEIRKIRRRIQDKAGIDILAGAKTVPEFLRNGPLADID